MSVKEHLNSVKLGTYLGVYLSGIVFIGTSLILTTNFFGVAGAMAISGTVGILGVVSDVKKAMSAPAVKKPTFLAATAVSAAPLLTGIFLVFNAYSLENKVPESKSPRMSTPAAQSERSQCFNMLCGNGAGQQRQASCRMTSELCPGR